MGPAEWSGKTSNNCAKIESGEKWVGSTRPLDLKKKIKRKKEKEKEEEKLGVCTCLLKKYRGEKRKKKKKRKNEVLLSQLPSSCAQSRRLNFIVRAEL